MQPGWTSRKLSPLLLSALACAAACSAPSPEDDGPVRSTESAIIGGGQTSGHPAVGMLFQPTSNFKVCSGFLIAPNLVVTAAHCFSPNEPPVWFSTSDGAPVARPERVDDIPGLVKHEVDLFVRHPQAKLSGTGAQYPWRFDYAVARLKTPISAAPLTYGTSVAKDAVCTMVGYGLNAIANGTGGRKKEGNARVTRVVQQDEHSVLTLAPAGGAMSGTAHRGDSGGPFLCNGVAVGVFSYIANYDSTTSPRYYGGTDGSVKTWLDSMVATYALPPPDAGADASADSGAKADDAGAPTAPDAARPSAPTEDDGGPNAESDGASSSCATNGTATSPSGGALAAAGLFAAMLAVRSKRSRRARPAPRPSSAL